jgi:hypothetical protein
MSKSQKLHTIPSGFGKMLLNFPINIHSLREYEGEKQKVDLFQQTHKLPTTFYYNVHHKKGIFPKK